MTTKKPAVKKVVDKPSYTATLSLYGKTYVGTGATVMEAVEAITLKNAPKVRGVLTLTKGSETKDRILNPLQVQRLFALSPMMRQVQLKNVSLLFGL